MSERRDPIAEWNERFGVRRVEVCCGSCKHFDNDYGTVSCKNPENHIPDGEDEIMAAPDDAGMVCPRWEGKKPATAVRKAKPIPEIIQDMFDFYEANAGYPCSAAAVYGYAKKLEASMQQEFPARNESYFSDANDAVRHYRETHKLPEDLTLPQWVKDFVNWLFAEKEEDRL